MPQYYIYMLAIYYYKSLTMHVEGDLGRDRGDALHLRREPLKHRIQ